jgi:hypothetical protein
MKLIKKRKILQIFFNGSSNFGYFSFFFPKDNQFFFYEKDFKMFYLNIKKKDHININVSENSDYRKKYVDI